MGKGKKNGTTEAKSPKASVQQPKNGNGVVAAANVVIRQLRLMAPTATSTPPPEIHVPHPNHIGHTRARSMSERTATRAFLEDDVIGAHWIFRLIMFVTRVFYKSIHTFDTVNTDQPKTARLLFSRHSTHCAEILPTAVLCYESTGRVARMLLHRLIVKSLPWITLIGGVAGERVTAVALLKAGFYAGVVPGGADEGLVGHENTYRVIWPTKRVGFAKVAMEADAALVPYFVRNVEEARWNPFFELWHLIRGVLLYEYLVNLNIPIFSSLLYTAAHCIWFGCTFFQIPIPVRCTMVWGDPVPYQPEESTDIVVARCQVALQDLIIKSQPNALEGRNYTRAMWERWEEWKGVYPGVIKPIEKATPKFVKSYLKKQAGCSSVSSPYLDSISTRSSSSSSSSTSTKKNNRSNKKRL